MAIQDYVINFTDGESTPISLPVGKYTFVSTDIPGYENNGTTMVTFEVKPDSTVIPIQISANGKLTVEVKDVQGAGITDGKILLCNSDDSKTYGSAAQISEGKAEFDKMPYTAAGVDFYLKQNGSDAGHKPLSGVQAASMTEKEHTESILNGRRSFNVTFTVEDEVYDGITDFTGNLTVNG